MAPDPPASQDGPAQRLFLAIEVPPSVRSAVADAIAPWRAAFASARWVASEDWHLSVKFLGRTPAERVPWVLERVRAIASLHRPVGAAMHGLGVFPSAGRATVLWAGVDDPDDGVASIAKDLDAELDPTFAPEQRAFAPHVTVARARPPLVLPAAYLQTSLGPEPFTVSDIVVFRSHLGRGAPRYERIAGVPLDG